MSTYLKLFNNHQGYDAFTKTSDFIKPNVSHCIEENEVHYNPSGWKYEYLTFEVVEGGTITIKANNADIAKTISYSVDNGGTWTSLTTTTEEQALGGTLNVGDKVLVKGNNATYGTVSYYNTFGGTAKVKVYGNIMSLISGDNFADSVTLNGNYTFYSLFREYTNLLSAENLILPATTLADSCYARMFYGCTSLTKAPELPATTLAVICYGSMFSYCTSLTKAPELPATTLTLSCYISMFNGCRSLVNAPELPATTLASSCYNDMFQGCASLTTAPDLPATTLVYNCYNSMFEDCASLTKAPELPATTLTDSCYNRMFYDCTKLNYIKAMFTTTPSSPYTGLWVNGVASTGTFVKNGAATWNVSGRNGVPSGWTVETATE